MKQLHRNELILTLNTVLSAKTEPDKIEHQTLQLCVSCNMQSLKEIFETDTSQTTVR